MRTKEELRKEFREETGLEVEITDITPINCITYVNPEYTKYLEQKLLDQQPREVREEEIDRLAKDFAIMIQTKEGTVSRLNAIEWYKQGIRKGIAMKGDYDEGYKKGYSDASSEAYKEIQKNYRPNND